MTGNLSQTQDLKQTQRLIMSPQMQQAIHMLQMPILEINAAVEAELEQNPVLEHFVDDDDDYEQEETTEETEQELSFDDRDLDILKQLDEDFRDHFAESENYYTKRTADEEKRKTFLDSLIIKQPTLFEHLTSLAKETFTDPKELEIAEILIGNLDASGYLGTKLEEIALLHHFEESRVEKVLKEIQTFEPYGVGATTLNESLLIQLRCKGKENSLAYQIVSHHYEDLLHNRIPAITKHLRCSSDDIRQSVERDISKLDLHPGTLFSDQPQQYIIPDATLREDGNALVVDINHDHIPYLRLNSKYIRMLDDQQVSKEDKNFIRHKVLSAKWLLRNIDQRNSTLHRMIELLLHKQKDFFTNPEGKLNPLTMKTLAEELEVHESTIARTVANKYLDCPRGILPLRFFFTNGYAAAEGTEISSKTVRDALEEIIRKENKSKPLSDEAISAKLKAQGMDCARRTVAKYRSLLNIGTARQRKQF